MKSLYGRIRLKFSDINSKNLSRLSHARAGGEGFSNNFKSNISNNDVENPSSDKRDISLKGLPPTVDCEKCPASSKWEWKGPGLWCFYSAYFLGKSAIPVACAKACKYCELIYGEMAGSGLK